MKGIESGGGAGRPAKPLKNKPPKAALDVLPTSKGEKPKPYRPPVAKKVVRKTKVKRKQIQHETRDTKSDADRQTAAEYKRTPEYLATVKDANQQRQPAKATGPGLHLDVANREADRKPLLGRIKDRPRSDAEMRRFLETGDRPIRVGTRTRQQETAAKITAPAVKVLDQSLRTNRAVAGAADELVQGHGAGAALKAAKKGAINNKGPSFSKVLEHAGVKNKTIRSLGGFALDVGTDPLTYVTFGAGAPATALTKGAALKATEKALDSGATKKAADRAGRAAAKATLEDPKLQNKGLRVGVRAKVPLTDKGIDIKTSGRASSLLLRKSGASKVATKVRESSTVQGVGKAFVHDFKPVGRSAEQHAAIRSGAREHRARTAAAARANERRYGKALKKAAPSTADHQQIVDAIESKTIDQLPPHLQDAARAVKGDLGRMYSQASSRGLSKGKFKPSGPDDAQAYVPHTNKLSMEGGGAHRGGSVKVKPDKGRGIRKSMAALRAAGDQTFSEDLPRVMATKANKEAGRASLHDFWQKVAKTGERVQPGKPLNLKRDDMVYEVTPEGLSPVAKTDAKGDQILDKAKLADIVNGKQQGRYVVLQRADVEDVKGRLANRPSDDEVLRGYDKAQGFLKTIYTVPNPAYHLRNLYGDSLNAFLGDTSANSFRRAAQVLETRVVKHKAERSAGQFAGGATPTRLTKPIKINGKSYSHGQLLKEAESVGAISQGFIGRELTDLTGKSGPLQRLSQYREDLPRLATYLSARERGLNPSQASEWVQKHHFDYADVTSFERKVARRIIPFYTFFARNTRLQASKVFTRPGKVATFAKVLNDSAQAAGFKDYDEYAKNLKDYEQRGLPVPILVGGKVYNAFVTPPETDLNQLTAHPGDQLQSLANRVTFFKTVGELALNYSVFFQGPIQDEQHPLVEAPPQVGSLPGIVRKKLGITNDWINPKTGRKSWAWPSKVDYTIRSLPEGNFTLGQMLPDRGTRNQTPAQSRLAFATGVRTTPYKTDARDLSTVKQQVFDLDKQLAKLRDSGHAEDPKLKGHYTKQYQGLLDERKKLMDQRGTIEKKIGMPDAKASRLKRRPLTEDEKFDQSLQKFLDKDPEKDLEDRLNKFLESTG